ncbi:MAG TPA: hypothetical protein VES20_20380 [Bryobacteraceae bacterium]|nr:hypothetical protein [Bryobacteraceae bacterium]
MRHLLAILFLCMPLAAQNILWRDPGRISDLDFRWGAGGAKLRPAPPFHFIEADDSGTTPKLLVRDGRGRTWNVKFGDEVRAETFASRLVWALGYHSEPTHYLPAGRVLGTRRHHLGRASRHVSKSGQFRDARFELRDPKSRFLENNGWSWENNPFVRTRELNGLRTLVMLLSGWDNKDARDDTSNTSILQTPSGARVYFVSDWGASMGKWGNFFTREKWDCEGFRAQTSDFVKAVDRGNVRFGFAGKHDGDFKKQIRVSDVRWLMRRLSQISDTQLRSALRSSGASRHESSCFVSSLRARIRQLQRATEAPVLQARRP